MSPFAEFRMWLREGPPQERVLAAAATAVALALIMWAIVPLAGNKSTASSVGVSGGASQAGTPGAMGSTGSSGTSGAAAGGTGSTSGSGSTSGTGSTASGGSATPLGTVASGTARGGSPSGSGTTSSGSGPARSTTPAGQSTTSGAVTCHNQATATGVTATTVKIGYINYDLANAGPLIGLPTPQQDQAQFKALIDYYNAHGGIQCRKIVASYYNDTLTDTTEHSDCLQAQQDGIFAMVFDFFTPQERPCLPAAGVPQFGITPAPRSTVQQYYPYDLSWREDENRLVRDYVFGSNKYGWFKGMGKLGVLDSTCYPEYSTELYRDLSAIGIPKSSVSIYNYGCPASISGASPDQNNEAVVQFKLAHVTNVMSVYYAGIPQFAQQAQAQSYQPKYDIMDDNTWSLIQDANPPDSPTMNGAFGITKIEDGAEHYSNYPWNAATAQCMAIDKAAGVGSPTQTGVTAIYGAACASLQLLVDSANATVPLVRNGLAQGMAALGALQLSYPAGPSEFNDPTNPTGDHYYRAGIYDSSCECFKLVDGTFQPQFTASGQPQSGLSPIYTKP